MCALCYSEIGSRPGLDPGLGVGLGESGIMTAHSGRCADPRGIVEKLRTQAGPREALQNSVKLAGFVDVDTTPDTRVDTEAETRDRRVATTDSKSESDSDSESTMDSIGLRIEGAARVGVVRGLRVRLGLGDTLGLRHGFGRRPGVGVRVRVRIRLGRGLGHGLGVGFGHGLRVKH